MSSTAMMLSAYGLTGILCALALLVSFTTAAVLPKEAVPAFPGAEGFGASTSGGRNGAVLLVDRLDDYEADAAPIAGTLRWALETGVDQRGARVDRRIVVFEAGGVIALRRPLVIRKPFVTIAGQTASGDGITIKNDALIINTHDVIIRGLRLRVGDLRQRQRRGVTPDGITISTAHSTSDVYNVIIDHCSLSWALDENGSAWETRKNTYALRNITIQWSIISEGLRDQERRTSMGFLVGDGVRNMTIHHNLFAHNNDRNPGLQMDVTAEIINNVVYNWHDGSTTIKDSNRRGRPSNIDLIGNYYKTGPAYRNDAERGDYRGISVARSVDSRSRVFVRGNIGPGRPADIGDEWDAVQGNAKLYRSFQPVVERSRFPVSVDTATAAYRAVLADAGATVPRRDAVDARIVREVKHGAVGRIIDLPDDRGGYPSYNDPTNKRPPADADRDGMPDTFEMANTRDGSATTLDPEHTASDGYTWIEVYINTLLVDRNTALR